MWIAVRDISLSFEKNEAIAIDSLFTVSLAWAPNPCWKPDIPYEKRDSKAQVLPQAAGSLGLTSWRQDICTVQRGTNRTETLQWFKMGRQSICYLHLSLCPSIFQRLEPHSRVKLLLSQHSLHIKTHWNWCRICYVWNGKWPEFSRSYTYFRLSLVQGEVWWSDHIQ